MSLRPQVRQKIQILIYLLLLRFSCVVLDCCLYHFIYVCKMQQKQTIITLMSDAFSKITFNNVNS